MTTHAHHHRAGRLRRLGTSLALAGALLLIGAETTQNAVANGDTRTINLYHIHSKESLSITFKRNGRYDQAALGKLNHFLRDWRNQKQTKMEPRLFDVLWEVYRETGSRKPIHIVSSYRSVETNKMLRSRSKGVAKNSQHTLGRAIDFHLPDVPMSRAREAGLRLQRGGVGFYPSSGLPFVHVDVGSVRHWPRMTRSQLARLFPDGKTVHLPSDGKPLAGYAVAKAEIERNRASGGTMMASNSRGGGFLSNIFGGGGDDDEETTPAPATARTPTAPTPVSAPAAPRAPEPAPAVVAVAAVVPLPTSRPAALATAAAPTTVAEARPSGPDMIWNRGAAPAASASQGVQTAALTSDTTPGSAAPAMPFPRPASAARGTTPADLPVTAFAPTEASIPLPMLRPSQPVLASAGGLPGRSLPPLGQPEPKAAPARQMAALSAPVAQQKPAHGTAIGDRVAKAYPEQGRAAASTAAPLAGRNLDSAAVRAGMTGARSARDGKLTMSHPNASGANLLAAPAQIVQAGFGANPTNGLRSDAFAGSSVAILRSRTFSPTRQAGPLEVDIPQRRG